MSIRPLIRQVLEAGSVVESLTAGRRLRRAVRLDGNHSSAARLLIASSGEAVDFLGQALLLRALAQIEAPAVDDVFAAVLADDERGLREQAAWALAGRRPVRDALPGLGRLLVEGGFGAMLAEMTLETWSGAMPLEISRHLRQAFDKAEGLEARERLVEVLGFVREPGAQGFLERLILEAGVPDALRAAAVRGLEPWFVPAVSTRLIEFLAAPNAGLRRAAAERLRDLAGAGHATARRALKDFSHSAGGVAAAVALQAVDDRGQKTDHRSGGLRFAQVVLQGRVDPGLEGVGTGDSGGLATLLVSLGRALGARPEMEHVFTVARGFDGPGVPDVYHQLEEPMGEGASLVRVPFGPPADLSVADMWRHRLAIERGLERLFRRLGRLDGVHLRFADAGTLAAARVARRLRIPVFFTLAPDPHSVIQAAERSGTLDRRTFAAADRREHYLFRAELVEEMLERARRLALFPRPALEKELHELLDVDVLRDRARFQTIPEGIDMRQPERAEREVRSTGPRSPVLDELTRRIDRLGPKRCALPLLVSVGRLHPVKGLHRLVRAWAGDPRLREGYNLLLIGGGAERPNDVEAAVLERIEKVLDDHPEGRDGLLLFGQRSNRDAARLLAAARWGVGDRVAPGGVYVCASDKEEFGLAILEALAAGLAVVAPDAGGPATYIVDGENGYLARTASVPLLRAAIHRAAAGALDAGRARRARRTVREGFTVEAMAGSLAGMYDAPVRRRLEAAA